MALRAVPDHPKFAELMAALEMPKFATLGALEAVWHFTGRFTPQGDIGKYTDAAIEAWAGWNGEPGRLIESLVTCRWIDADPVHRLLVHDWDQHADKATKNALMRSKRTFCTPGVRTPSVQHTNTNPESSTVYRLPVPVPEPVPEPEPKNVCAAASAAPALDRSGEPIVLPLVDGKEWPVTAQDCVAWGKAYPAVEIDVELLKAREWLISNPRNRKTPRGMRRFLTSWLGRAQDRARTPAGAAITHNPQNSAWAAFKAEGDA
ncbi:MAG: hypothetical protein ACLGSD_13870 [Acidobacteriota bacterium]